MPQAQENEMEKPLSGDRKRKVGVFSGRGRGRDRKKVRCLSVDTPREQGAPRHIKKKAEVSFCEGGARWNSSRMPDAAEHVGELDALTRS